MYDLIAVLLGMLVAVAFISIAVIVLIVISYWKIFEKAGEDGWKALIPYYNSYILYKIGWETKWFFVMLGITVADMILFMSGVPALVGFSWVLTLANLGIMIPLSINLAKNFGKTGGFAAGLILLPLIFYPILAFGSSQYVRNQTENPGATF